MYQEILETDNMPDGTAKMNANFVELYAAIDAAAPESITGAESLDATAFGKIHLCSGTTVDYTIDLPTAAGNSGKSLILKGIGALTKVVTIQGVSGQLIDGESTRKFSSEGSFTLISDGTGWHILNEVGSWIPYTPVLTGYSADPTFLRTDYWRVGKLCTVRITSSASGTSNATTKTITVPFNSAEISHGVCTVIVNGTVATTPGVCATRVASATMDVYRNNDLGTTAWTASGNSRFNCQVTYRIA